MSKENKIILVQARKYDGIVHKSWEATLLTENCSLLVLDGTFNIDIKHPALGHIKKGTRSIEFYWLNRWYNVFSFFEPDDTFKNFYCNINLPPSFNGEVLQYIDLDTDILVMSDFSYTILDQAEFAENSIRYRYSDEVKQNAEKALAELMQMIEKRAFPFNI